MQRTNSREQGAVIVLCTVWLVAFLTFIALGLNVYFLGAMLLQQRNGAEYIALAAVKLMTSPPDNARCRNQLTPFARADCIADRAELAGAFSMLGASYSQLVQDGDLRPRSGTCASCPNPQPDPKTQSSFSWCGFLPPQSGRGYIILGSYSPTTGSFTPACPNELGSASMPTAAFVHLNLRNNGTNDLIMPFISFLGGSSGIAFSSRALAYQNGNLILLAEDPMLR
jgi:hypothetical protein